MCQQTCPPTQLQYHYPRTVTQLRLSDPASVARHRSPHGSGDTRSLTFYKSIIFNTIHTLSFRSITDKRLLSIGLVNTDTKNGFVDTKPLIYYEKVLPRSLICKYRSIYGTEHPPHSSCLDGPGHNVCEPDSYSVCQRDD